MDLFLCLLGCLITCLYGTSQQDMIPILLVPSSLIGFIYLDHDSLVSNFLSILLVEGQSRARVQLR